MNRFLWLVVAACLPLHSLCLLHTAKAQPPAAATPIPLVNEVRQLLIRLAISPESAAAAGVTPSQVQDMFDAAAQFCDAYREQARQAHEAVNLGRDAVESVRRTVFSSEATRNTALATAEQQLTQAISQQNQLYQTAHDAITASLDPAVRTRIGLVRQSVEHRVGIEYLVVTRSDSQWLDLKKALEHVRSCRVSGTEPTAEMVAIVQTADADQVVAQAKQRLNTTLSALRNAWRTSTSALGQQP